MTGQTASWITRWLTEPRSIPAKPPRPREPTTMRPASLPSSLSVAPGSPMTAWVVTSIEG